MSAILPDGLPLVDVPYPIFESITAGLSLLGLEELPDDERPPKRIWFNAKLMAEHTANVKKAREERYRSPRSPDGDDEMKQNDAAKDLIVG